MRNQYEEYISPLSKEDVANLFLYVEDTAIEDELLPLRDMIKIYGRYLTLQEKLKLKEMYARK